MELLLDFVFHVDAHLVALVQAHGAWVYGILFLIVFCETGLVVTPFLPGDSLLFAAGALAGAGALALEPLVALLVAAAIAGDVVNYSLGRRAGDRVERWNSRWLNREHLTHAQRFYARHGGKAIVLARFAPFLRTFAPFVAGVGRMDRRRFLFFNVTGGSVWVLLFVAAGYFFGGLPAVQEHFSLVVVAIVALSLLPVAVELLRTRLRESDEEPQPGSSFIAAWRRGARHGGAARRGAGRPR